ncbi:large conductance mechanosensitive channel protein MscL [Actinomycetaceae bacterium L2_0104]
MIKGFREFIMRGNVLDMAIGIIIGAAFTPIVEAISNILLDIIGALFGAPEFAQIWTVTINGTDILPGTILTALVNFLLVAAALYFFVVLPMNKFNERIHRNDDVIEEAADANTELLTEIRDLLAQSNQR